MSDLEIIKSWQNYTGQTLEDGDLILVDDGQEARVKGTEVFVEDGREIIIVAGYENDGVLRDDLGNELAQIQAYKKPGFIGKSKTIKNK